MLVTGRGGAVLAGAEPYAGRDLPSGARVATGNGLVTSRGTWLEGHRAGQRGRGGQQLRPYSATPVSSKGTVQDMKRRNGHRAHGWWLQSHTLVAANS